jgi:hypothetical protein
MPSALAVVTPPMTGARTTAAIPMSRAACRLPKISRVPAFRAVPCSGQANGLVTSYALLVEQRPRSISHMGAGLHVLSGAAAPGTIRAFPKTERTAFALHRGSSPAPGPVVSPLITSTMTYIAATYKLTRHSLTRHPVEPTLAPIVLCRTSVVAECDDVPAGSGRREAGSQAWN